MHRLLLLPLLLIGLAGCQIGASPPTPTAPEAVLQPADVTVALPTVAAGTPSPASPTAMIASPIAGTVIPRSTTPGSTPSPTPAPRPLTAVPGGGTPPAPTPIATTPSTHTPVPATPTPWLPQTREVGPVRVRLLEYVRGMTPDGQPVVRLKAEMANQGDREAFFADLYFKLETADGHRQDPIINVESADRLQQGPLAPGQSTTGFLWYLIPNETRITAVFYDGPTGQTTFAISA